jgi:hypothetical protein
MTDSLAMLAYLAPMLGILGLFWNVARKLGQIESELKDVREQNRNLRAEVSALRDLMGIVIDSRRVAG